jgi:hypothetical protein
MPATVAIESRESAARRGPRPDVWLADVVRSASYPIEDVDVVTVRWDLCEPDPKFAKQHCGVQHHRQEKRGTAWNYQQYMYMGIAPLLSSACHPLCRSHAEIIRIDSKLAKSPKACRRPHVVSFVEPTEICMSCACGHEIQSYIPSYSVVIEVYRLRSILGGMTEASLGDGASTPVSACLTRGHTPDVPSAIK